MVPVTALWLPILLAAVLVFIASSIIHMLTPWHAGDMRALPGEAQAMNALRPLHIPPGDYAMPYAGSMAAMKSPEFQERVKAGPVAFLTVTDGSMSMAGSLLTWFVYTVIVGIFAAYVAGAALPMGASYLEVFRFAGTTAFAGYSLALMQNSIWWKRNWAMTIRSMIDGLLYACLTAGTLGWLWPR